MTDQQQATAKQPEIHPAFKGENMYLYAVHPFPHEYLGPLIAFGEDGLLPAAIEVTFNVVEGAAQAWVTQGIVGVHFDADDLRGLRFHVPADIKGTALRWLLSDDRLERAVMTIAREVAAAAPERAKINDRIREAELAIFELLALPADSPYRYDVVLSREDTPTWFAGKALPRHHWGEGYDELTNGRDRFNFVYKTARALQAEASELCAALSFKGIVDYLKTTYDLDSSVVDGLVA